MYSAVVTQLKTLNKHPKADRLQLALVDGVEVITDLNAKCGDFYAYFPSDGVLYHEFLLDNKLYRKDPETGVSLGGFFEPNGRVTTIKLFGEKSDGFIFPLPVLNTWLTNKNLPTLPYQDGYEFSSIGSIQFCSKYYSKATKDVIEQNKIPKEKKEKTVTSHFFKRHFDTNNFYRWIKSYKWEFFDRIIITEKLHGTSGRFGYFRKPLTINKYFYTFINWLLTLAKLPLYKPFQYTYFLGSRNTNCSLAYRDSDKHSYRQKLVEPLKGKLLPGEMLYFEIVGYTEQGQPLFHQNVEISKDKELIKRFGKKINYSYGCEPNSLDKPKNKLFVYRITHTNEDSGEIRELSWKEIQKRCEELNLNIVPLVSCTNGEYMKHLIDTDPKQFETLHCELDTLESSLDDRHLKEGVCVRLEREDGTIKVSKIKTFNFKLLEGLIKADSETIDEEEIS